MANADTDVKDTDVVDDKSADEGKDEAAVTTPELTPVEQQAFSYGWKPKDEWVKEGNDADDWVPAKHFLKFGELKQQTISKDKELQKQQKLFKMMKDHHIKVKEVAMQEAINALRKERKEALDANDLVTAEKLRDEMDALKERQAREKILPPEVEQELATKEDPVPQPNPEFIDWHAKNPWYITQPDKQDDMSRDADLIGQAVVLDAQRKGKVVTAAEVYKVVEKEIKQRYADKFKTPKSPQEDSPRGTGTSSSGKGVKLTEEQLKVAATFGISPEKYAQELKSYEKGKKW